MKEKRPVSNFLGLVLRFMPNVSVKKVRILHEVGELL